MEFSYSKNYQSYNDAYDFKVNGILCEDCVSFPDILEFEYPKIRWIDQFCHDEVSLSDCDSNGDPFVFSEYKDFPEHGKSPSLVLQEEQYVFQFQETAEITDSAPKESHAQSTLQNETFDSNSSDVSQKSILNEGNTTSFTFTRETSEDATIDSCDNENSSKFQKRDVRDSNTGRTVSLEDLKGYFHLPIAEASKALGVGMTYMKRRCRELKIYRWPHRKLKSLDNLITNIKSMASKRECSPQDIQNCIKELQVIN